jgi:hypothetical protein
LGETTVMSLPTGGDWYSWVNLLSVPTGGDRYSWVNLLSVPTGGDWYSWVNLLSVPTKGVAGDRYKSPGPGGQGRMMLRKFLSFSVLSDTLR